jgi:hypothetical protein
VIRFEQSESPLRVGPNEPRVASHISGKERGQLGFDPLGRHSKTTVPPRVNLLQSPKKVLPCGRATVFCRT